jgi:hypothetical protein
MFQRLTCIVVADARQLLLPSLSVTVVLSSAQARRKWIPADVDPEILTLTVPVETSRIAGAGGAV